MNLAYCIQVHNNPNHLLKLIKALDNKNVSFYIHIDKKSRTKFNIPNQTNIHILSNTVSVFWGGFSQVQASLNLLNEASKSNKHDYYIFISGVDYPVRSNNYILNFFEKFKGKEFIDLYEMPLFDKTFDRINYFRFEGHENFLLNFIYSKINFVIKLMGIKRKFPEKYNNLKLFSGASWWAFSHKCVKYILSFIQNNPEFLSFYKNTLCADEMFFQTIIGNSKYNKSIMNSIIYTDWSGFPKPAFISQKHFEIFKKDHIEVNFGNGKQYLLFARKFTDMSKNEISYIDINFRKNT